MIERLCDKKGKLEKDSVTGVFQNFPDWLFSRESLDQQPLLQSNIL